MKLNTNVYELKNVYNQGTESEYTTSDIISNIVKNKFTDLVPDTSLLICHQADDSPFNELFTCTEYRGVDDFDYTSKKCEFGIFPFIVLESGFARGCMDYSEAWDTGVVPITENYPQSNSQILTKYDYKKLVVSIGFNLLYNGNTYWYGSIDEFINNSYSMDFIGFAAITSMVVNFAYNGIQLNTTGYGNSSGAIMLSENENWFHSSEGFLTGSYNWTTSLPTKRVVINHNNVFIDTRSDKTSAVLIKTTGMTKREIIDFLRSLTSRFGYIFSDNREGVFGTGNTYLPEIINGVSTGRYFATNNLENVTSDNIDWTDRIDIDTKTPITDDDDIDDMELGVGGNYSGMIKYYRLSPAQLVAFSEEIQNPDIIPAGYDIFKNIIALKRYPINLSKYAEFSEAEQMKVGSVTLNLSASRLAFEKRNISLGKYTIPGYHGSKGNPHFLDFSPYTTAEVFIPYCGFVTLPVDKIMYNEIEVRFLVDIKLGNCTGIVKCNGNIVGEKAGILGSDIPLVAVNMGVAMGAIIQGLTDSTFGFASAIPYAATGNIGATFSGILNGTSALTQTIMSSKKNYTEVIGNTGGDIMFSMPDRCYIKLTYPKKELPDNYGKMVGYMCGKGGRLGDFKGFTICENVHVNVKATEDEKQMILEKLLTGVIMPYNN